MLREYRGDAHVAAWSSRGVDAVEIGLLTEAYMGLPLRTYIRTRGWNDAELDAAVIALEKRGWVASDALTAEGRAERESMETATDRAMEPAIDAVGDDHDELIALCSRRGARRFAKPAATSPARSTFGPTAPDAGTTRLWHH